MTKSHSCEYCRTSNIKYHNEGCPQGDTGMIAIWNQARVDAKVTAENPHPEDPTYTLGFMRGQSALTTVERSRLGLPLDHERRDPPARHSLPGTTELGLALDDRRREPSLRPGMHPVAALKAELEAREADQF